MTKDFLELKYLVFSFLNFKLILLCIFLKQPLSASLRLKADTLEEFCSRSMVQSHFAGVSTHEGAFSSSLNLPRELAPKYLTG